MVGRGGFEPPKSLTADLQSAPFGHSGTYPYKKTGAGGRTRTPDLLITNQLLYQLSYTSLSKLFADLSRRLLEYNTTSFSICQHFFAIFFNFFYFIFLGCFLVLNRKKLPSFRMGVILGINFIISGAF